MTETEEKCFSVKTLSVVPRGFCVYECCFRRAGNQDRALY